MNTSIFVPKKLCVGYCNRKDTYTGKLAYVIYYDAQGKLRKETSWQNWRDNTIEPQEFDNEPTEGFVINKKVGGVGYYNVRQTYARVYDPRGFEFEITIPNLLWILENCDCIKGKGLVGQFVYGWDNKDLVLVPVESPDYKEIQGKAEIAYENKFIKPSELVIGATYEMMDGRRRVYMGKFPYWSVEYNHENSVHTWRWNRQYLGTYEKPMDVTPPWNSAGFQLGYEKHRLVRCVKGKDKFWFIDIGEFRNEYSKGYDCVESMSSVSRKFIRCVSTNTEEYERYLGILNQSDNYSPIDYEKSGIRNLPFKNFKDLYLEVFDKGYGQTFYVCYGEKEYEGCHFYRHKNGRIEIHGTGYEDITQENLKQVYNELVPIYGEEVLVNGSINRRYGYYEKQ